MSVYMFSTCPVCGSALGFEYSGTFGKYAKCCSCRTKWRMIFVNKQLAGLSLHELPKNGACLHTIKSTGAPLFQSIGMPLDLKFWKTLDLGAEVEWTYLSESVDNALTRGLVLKHRERVLYSWRGSRLIGGTELEERSLDSSQVAKPGTLVLTNQRLLWLDAHQSGFWRHLVSYKVRQETSLESIRGIFGQTGDSSNWDSPKTVSIVDDKGETTFNLKNAFIEILKTMVNEALKMARANTPINSKE